MSEHIIALYLCLQEYRKRKNACYNRVRGALIDRREDLGYTALVIKSSPTIELRK